MHVWTASIIAGLAVVLTGTIAYTAAEAKTTGAVTLAAAIDQVHTLTLRTQQLEGTLRSLTTLCGGKELPPSAAPSDTPTADDGQSPTPKPRPTSCVEQCTQATMSCLKKAGENSEMRQGCARADRACRVSCAEDKSIQ